MFYKRNLKIEYPRPYTPEVWDYGKAQTDLINCAIDQSDWLNLFLSSVKQSDPAHFFKVSR